MFNVVNHKGGIGEIGRILANHMVVQKGTIGKIFPRYSNNHSLPETIAKNTNGFSGEEKLARIFGVTSYPGRILGSTYPEDIVQLGPDLKKGWGWICRHYDRINLSFSRQVIWNDNYAVASDFPNHRLSPFFYGDLADKVSPNQDRLRATRLLNQKNEAVRLASQSGVPVPATQFFSGKKQLQDCGDFEFPCVLKLSESVSGLGVAVCQSREELEKELGTLDSKVPFQIQAFLEADAFPSIQFGICENGDIRKITETVNFLEGSVHAGNWGGKTIDLQLDLLTERLVRNIAQLGYVGWLSFDLAYCQGQYYFLECNPRYTGAAYPFNVARKLKAEKHFWAHKNYPTGFNSLEEVDLGELEYDPKRKTGWVLVNWGPLANGEHKGGFLYLGDPTQFRRAEDQLQTFLA
jgi:hypothetical protein